MNKTTKIIIEIRDNRGLSKDEIIDRAVFLGNECKRLEKRNGSGDGERYLKCLAELYDIELISSTFQI